MSTEIVLDGPDARVGEAQVLADAGVYAVKVSPSLPQPEGKAIAVALAALQERR